MTTYSRRHFQMYFFEWKKTRDSIKIWRKFVPKSPFWQYSSIGSDNGLAPDRPQAIIWTNDGSSFWRWRIYESLGLNEL